MALVPLLIWPHALCLSGKQTSCQASGSASSSTFTVHRHMTDPVLKRVWAIEIDCGHPAWPPRVLEVRAGQEIASRVPSHPTPTKGTSEPFITVRFGARVELWSDAPTKLSLAGTALESGAAGQLIQVRAGLGFYPLCGRIRGPRSVELVSNAQACRR